MSKAILTYTSDRTNISLESGSLFYIDQQTKKFHNIDDIKEYYNLESGNIKLYYISGINKKDEVPLLVNDNEPMYLRDDYYEKKISELEKGRKLLFNSKNKLFLRLSLKYKFLKDTLDFPLKLSRKEHEFVMKKGIDVTFNEDGYFINSIDLFSFVLSNNRYGILRGKFEKALEKWRDSFSDMSLEDVYYYSRNVRILIRKYEGLLKRKIGIKNFEPNNENLDIINKEEIRLIKGKTSKKVLRKTKE